MITPFLFPKHLVRTVPFRLSKHNRESKDLRMPTPRPGRAVRGSTQGRPLLAAMDLLGRRWALRILWELREGPVGARALRTRCDTMSSSVLYTRLEELTTAGLVEQDDSGEYRLTRIGAALGGALEPLDAWARRWAKELG